MRALPTKDKIKNYVIIAITIVIILLLTVFLYENKESLLSIKDISLKTLLILLVLIIIPIYNDGHILNLFTKPFNIILKEKFLLIVAVQFLNAITPIKGGTGLRAIYMKNKYNLDYSKFLSVFLGNYVLIFLTSSIFSFIAILWLYVQTDFFNPYFFIIFLGILISTSFFVFSTKKFQKENIITSKLNKIIDGWNNVKKNKKIIYSIILLMSVNIIITGFANQIAFAGLGYEIPFSKAFYIAVFSLLIYFINITPGAIGIMEMFYLFIGNTLQIPPEISVLAAILIRTVRYSIILTLGPIFYFILAKKIKKPVPEFCEINTSEKF